MKTGVEASDEPEVAETRPSPTGIKTGRVALPAGLGVLSLVFGFIAMIMIGLSAIPVEAGAIGPQQSEESGDRILFLAVGVVFALLSLLAVGSIPWVLGSSESFRTRSLATIGTALVVVLLLAGAWHFLSELSNQPPATVLDFD